MDLIKYVQDSFVEKKEFPEFRAGDTITVYYEIKEGNKTRTQFFRGVVIQLRGQGATRTFTIRKMSGTVGVERIFPFNMPAIQKIELNKSGKVRRARIFYLRALTGKKARIKERGYQSAVVDVPFGKQKNPGNASGIFFVSCIKSLFVREK